MNQAVEQRSAATNRSIVVRSATRIALAIGLTIGLIGIGVTSARSIKDWVQKDQVAAIGRPLITDSAQLIPVAGSWRFPEPQPTPIHLLPLDNGATQICGRWSDDGRLLMELVKLEADGDDLIRLWKQAGWEIQHTIWGDSHSFSYLCVKDGTVIYAWSPDSKFITQLMLSSSPDVVIQPPEPTAIAAGITTP